MRYWDDMQDKWGFSDGNAVPPDAEELRGVYIQGINHLAEEFGSQYRVAPFDRPGMHNWCLIVNVQVGQSVEDALRGPEGWDAGIRKAVDAAYELGLDDYVRTTTVVLQDELTDLLTNLEVRDEWNED